MKKQIENNRWARGDMEFLSECSTRYFMSERSKREEGDFIHVSKRERVGIHPQRYIHCVTCKQVIGDLKHVKISLFFFFFPNMCRSGFSHWWKSLQSTPVNIIKVVRVGLFSFFFKPINHKVSTEHLNHST